MRRPLELIEDAIEVLFAIIGFIATILLTLAAVVVPVFGILSAIGSGDPVYLLLIVTTPIFLKLALFTIDD